MKRLGYALGLPFVGLGAYLVLNAAPWPALRSVVLWFGGGIVLHDAVIAPLAILVGVLVLRIVPPVARAPVQAALVITGCLAIATFPLVWGQGVDPSVPSQLPLSYGRNLLIVLALVWLVAAAFAVGRVLRPGDRQVLVDES